MRYKTRKQEHRHKSKESKSKPQASHQKPIDKQRKAA
jgi:hypothetical protein